MPELIDAAAAKTSELLADDQSSQTSHSKGRRFQSFRRLVAPPYSGLGALELATVCALVVMSLAFVRPLLEEWHLIGALGGIEAIGSYWGGVFDGTVGLRPLMTAPTSTVATLFSNLGLFGYSLGDKFGLAAAFACLLVAKYFAARWAVSPLIRGSNRWVVATLAAIMVPWSGVFLYRFASAQLSMVFLLVALGASVRMRARIDWRWLVVGSIAIFAMNAAYPGLVLCSMAIPLVVLLASKPGSPIRVSIQSALRAALPVVAGMLLFGGFAFWAIKAVGAGGYESAGLGYPDGQIPYQEPGRMLAAVYDTGYLLSTWTFALILVILTCLVGPSIVALARRSIRTWSTIGLAVGVLLLPLFSLTYASNYPWLADPDRVGFPLASGFVLLCIAALARFVSPPSDRGQLPVAILLVVAMFSGAAVVGYKTYQNYQLQRTVLDQAEPLIAAKGTKSVLVRDLTGKLGDTYTLYGDTLSVALNSEGIPVTAVLCTPVATDRTQPDTRRFMIQAATPDCEPVSPSAGQLILDVTPWPDGIRVTVGH